MIPFKVIVTDRALARMRLDSVWVGDSLSTYSNSWAIESYLSYTGEIV